MPAALPHLLLQRPARGLDHAALELVPRTVRIDDQAAVGGAPQRREPAPRPPPRPRPRSGIGATVLGAGRSRGRGPGPCRPGRGDSQSQASATSSGRRDRAGPTAATADRPAGSAPAIAASSSMKPRRRTRWAAPPGRAAPRCAPAGAAPGAAHARHRRCRRAERIARSAAAGESRLRRIGRRPGLGRRRGSASCASMLRVRRRSAAALGAPTRFPRSSPPAVPRRRARQQRRHAWPCPAGSKPNSSSRRHCTRMQWPGSAYGDHRGVDGGVVGAVMAVAAGPLGVPHGDRLGRRPSAFARAERSGYTPWVCDQTVRWPSRNSASAQDGAIEAWAT